MGMIWTKISCSFNSLSVTIYCQILSDLEGVNITRWGKLVQYHGCWCPGSLCRQVISNHDIDSKATFTHARSGGGRILIFPLRYRGCVHTYAERTRADLPFLEDNDGLEHAVSKRARYIGCWTHFLRSGFCSRSASAPRPRMCERM